MRRSRSSCTSISTAGKPRCCCTRFSRHARPSHYQRSVYGRQRYRGLAAKREGADISRCRSKLYPRRSRTSTNLVRTPRAYSAMSRELLGEVSTLADCMSGPGGGISVCSDEIRRQLRRRQARTGAAGPPPTETPTSSRPRRARSPPLRPPISHLPWPPQIGPGLPKSCLSRAPQICAGLLRFGYSAEKGSVTSKIR